MFTVKLKKEVEKNDFPKLKEIGLYDNLKELILVLEKNPYEMNPAFKKLRGKMKGYYSRRINRTHRLIYSVDEKKKEIVIHSAWSHYEK